MTGSTHTKLLDWCRPFVTPVLAGYWLLICVATHIPNPEELPTPDVSDKVLHFAAYFVLYSLLSLRHRLLRDSWPHGMQQARLLGICVAYAAVDELAQALPAVNRHADWLDWLADCGGLLTAAAATWWLRRRCETTVAAAVESEAETRKAGPFK